jgi:hypothetical protein
MLQSGRGFARAKMLAFDSAWPAQQILQTLSGESLTDMISSEIEDNPSSASSLARF